MTSVWYYWYTNRPSYVTITWAQWVSNQKKRGRYGLNLGTRAPLIQCHHSVAPLQRPPRLEVGKVRRECVEGRAQDRVEWWVGRWFARYLYLPGSSCLQIYMAYASIYSEATIFLYRLLVARLIKGMSTGTSTGSKFKILGSTVTITSFWYIYLWQTIGPRNRSSVTKLGNKI